MSLSDISGSPLTYIVLAGLVFVAFVVAARFVAQQVAEALRRRGLHDMAAIIVTSFGAQDVLQDYVSGYYLLLERNIKIGDHISLERGSGTVSEVRLRV